MELPCIESSIDSKLFFEEYVKKRRPVKLKNFKPKILEFWDNQYLKNKSGGEIVRCELRLDDKDQFGKGNYIFLNFSDFLDRIESGEQNLYLTTQKEDLNSGIFIYFVQKVIIYYTYIKI
jgi:hypothetical protein